MSMREAGIDPPAPVVAANMLEGKVAVIAGLGSGMGGASARLLAQHGADVGGIDVVTSPASDILGGIRAGGRRTSLAIGDLRDGKEVHAAFTSLLDDLGKVDILVTVAGGQASYQAFRRLDLWEQADWDEIFGRNIHYLFFVLRETLTAMIEQGTGGSIVMIGSISGCTTAPNHAAYGAAKAGSRSLARSLAVEYGDYGIRVNVVAPGAIKTDATAAHHAVSPQSTARIPIGRIGSPDDIANAILFFASPLSSYVTGQTLLVDGGASVTFPLSEEPPLTPSR